MGDYFDLDAASGVIDELIREFGKRSSALMPHEDMVASILRHQEGLRLVEMARERARFKGNSRCRDWTNKMWADVIVAQFSKNQGTASRYYREKIRGKWAYRFAAPALDKL
jgi:predicted lipoprotein with Yx(FWY)xxD motif